MLIYNVHTLLKTFAITYKGVFPISPHPQYSNRLTLAENESFDSLLDRITRKSGLKSSSVQAIKSGQDGGLVYEYKGEKYALEDGVSYRR